MEKLNGLVWARQSTIRVGDVHLGVRCTDADVQAILERALAAHLVPGVEAPPNYSVQIERPQDGQQVSPMHFVYEGAVVAARSRDPRRVVRALFNYLAARGSHSAPGLVSLAATALVTDGTAVLAPVALKGLRDVVERRLLANGLRIVDVPSVHVDTSSTEVVLGEPDLAVDWSALDALEELVPARGERDIPPAPGRYPITGWGVLVEGQASGQLDPAAAVVRAAQSVNDLATFHAGEVLERMAGLTRRVRMVALRWEQPAGIVASLADLSR